MHGLGDGAGPNLVLLLRCTDLADVPLMLLVIVVSCSPSLRAARPIAGAVAAYTGCGINVNQDIAVCWLCVDQTVCAIQPKQGRDRQRRPR